MRTMAEIIPANNVFLAWGDFDFFIDVPVGSFLFQEIVKSFIISWNIINY